MGRFFLPCGAARCGFTEPHRIVEFLKLKNRRRTAPYDSDNENPHRTVRFDSHKIKAMRRF